MTLTFTSLDLTPQSQRAQFSIAFILPGDTHAAGSRWHFRSFDPLFHHEHRLASGQTE